jgi:hypothetical protein
MKKFKVSVSYTVYKHVDLIVSADNEEHAKLKAWEGNTLEELDVSEDYDSLIFGEVAEIGGC